MDGTHYSLCEVPRSPGTETGTAEERAGYALVAGACVFLILCILLSAMLLTLAAESTKRINWEWDGSLRGRPNDDHLVDGKAFAKSISATPKGRNAARVTPLPVKKSSQDKGFIARQRYGKSRRQSDNPDIRARTIRAGEVLCLETQMLDLNPSMIVNGMPNECTYQIFDQLWNNLGQMSVGSRASIQYPKLFDETWLKFTIKTSVQGLISPRILPSVLINTSAGSEMMNAFKQNGDNFADGILEGLVKELKLHVKHVAGLHVYVVNYTKEDDATLRKMIQSFYNVVSGKYSKKFFIGFTRIQTDFDNTLKFLWQTSDLVIYHIRNSSRLFPNPWYMHPYAQRFNDTYTMKEALEQIAAAKKRIFPDTYLPLGVIFDVWPRECDVTNNYHYTFNDANANAVCFPKFYPVFSGAFWGVITPAPNADRINHFWGALDRCRAHDEWLRVDGVSVETPEGIRFKTSETLKILHGAGILGVLGVEPMTFDDFNYYGRMGGNPFTLIIAEETYKFYNFTNRRSPFVNKNKNPFPAKPPAQWPRKMYDTWWSRDNFFNSRLCHRTFSLDSENYTMPDG